MLTVDIAEASGRSLSSAITSSFLNILAVKPNAARPDSAGLFFGGISKVSKQFRQLTKQIFYGLIMMDARSIVAREGESGVCTAKTGF